MLAGHVDFDVSRMMFFVAIAAYHKCFFWFDACQASSLIDRGFERRSVVCVAVTRLDADDPIAFRDGDNRDFATELILLARLAFGDAFDQRAAERAPWQIFNCTGRIFSVFIRD